MARGFIRGTHHLTFCVGGAQEDYDFHVRLLGLKSVKKTVLFDGEIPIYHLYYGNGLGDPSTLLTAFPYRQAGWMGKRGTNQAKSLEPVGARGLPRLLGRSPVRARRRARARRAVRHRAHVVRHPCGIEYTIVGEGESDDREPYEGTGVPAEHAIRGAYGTTTSVREPDPMELLRHRGHGRQVVSPRARTPVPDRRRAGYGRDARAGRGARSSPGHLELRRGHDPSPGVRRRLGREPAGRQGLASSGLGFTDVSEPKDRGYFFSMYCRSPSGLLVEIAYGTPEGFLIDEAADELGTHMCIPPHWESRRSEISSLEPIETVETVVG